MTNKKVILVSMGGGGNAVATSFIDMPFSECGVGKDGQPPADAALAEALEVFCDRTANGRLVPRRVLAATSAERLGLKSSPYADLYPADARIIELAGSTIDNWAKGHNATSVEAVVEWLKAHAAALENRCIVWLFHSIGGGYGAGGGSQLLTRINEEFGGSIPVASFAVVPGTTLFNHAREAYNAVLSLNCLLQEARQILVFDNDAICKAASQALGSTPGLQDLNQMIGSALATLVSCMLWPDAAGTRLSVQDFHAALCWSRNLAINDQPEDQLEWGEVRPGADGMMVSISCGCEAASESDADAGLASRLMGGEPGFLSFKGNGLIKRIFGDDDSEVTKPGWAKVFAVQQGRPSAGGFEQAIPGAGGRVVLNDQLVRRRAVAAGCHPVLERSLRDLVDRFDISYQRKIGIHHYAKNGVNEDDFVAAREAVWDAITSLQNFY